jgi:hypothetical protein
MCSGEHRRNFGRRPDGDEQARHAVDDPAPDLPHLPDDRAISIRKPEVLTLPRLQSNE